MSRSPHGERGLKFQVPFVFFRLVRRSPHGERGLKCILFGPYHARTSRSPHGERGLKFADCDVSGLVWIVALLMESVD